MKSLTKPLFIIYSLVTLPFGIFALIAPSGMFETFGITLDSGGQLIARGYGATLVGYGLIFLSLYSMSDPRVVKSLLLVAIIFNLIEATIQGVARTNGIVLSLIWGNVAIHGLVALLSAFALLTYKLEK